MQIIRVVFGFIAAYFIVEELYLGPTDSIELMANFNMWGLGFTALTMLY